MKPFISILFLVIPVYIFSQDTIKVRKPKSDQDSLVYTQVEVSPEFPGGLSALYSFLKSNLKYPRHYAEDGNKKTVYLSFVIEPDGSISDLIVMNPTVDGALFDAEAVRVVKSMPKWKPGQSNGVPVRIKYYIPVKFQI